MKRELRVLDFILPLSFFILLEPDREGFEPPIHLRVQ